MNIYNIFFQWKNRIVYYFFSLIFPTLSFALNPGDLVTLKSDSAIPKHIGEIITCYEEHEECSLGFDGFFVKKKIPKIDIIPLSREATPMNEDSSLLSNAVISSISYSINFIWINRSRIETQNFLMTLNRPHQFESLIDFEKVKEEKKDLDLKFQYLKDWIIKNPSAPIYIWFDSEMNTPIQISRTQESILKYFPNRSAPIEFRDIRSIKKINNHNYAFSTDIPVYFRVDLARLMIAEYLLELNPYIYFVYTDFDIPSLNQEELFDLNTIRKLRKYGIIHGADGSHAENSFQIISTHNSDLYFSFQHALINACLKYAKLYSTQKLLSISGHDLAKPYYFGGLVFGSYPNMLKYYLHRTHQGSFPSESSTYFLNQSTDQDGLYQVLDAQFKPSDPFYDDANIDLPLKFNISLPPIEGDYQ